MKAHVTISNIINKNEFKILGDNIICSICQELLYDPVQCESCQNCFCKECITQWIKKSKSCPFKCEKIIFKGNRFVKNILSILKFKCDNNCDYEIPYLEIEKHYDEDCPKINFKQKYIELLKKYKTITKHQNLKFSINHNHILNVMFYNANTFSCDLCRVNLKDKYGLGCRTCNFDVCQNCIEKVKEKSLHEHPLELNINKIDFQCFVCKKKIQNKRCICCPKCKKEICFDCSIK